MQGNSLEKSMNKNNNETKVLLKEELDENILRLTLNDSERRNALSLEMIRQMSDAIQNASLNQKIKVIIIAAIAPTFCAGHDLKEMTAARKHSDQGCAFYAELFSSCSALMQLIINSPKPIIAEVSGVATAAGCQLVASCDIAIASDQATFATPGVNIGLFCSTPMVALSRNIANKHAMEMLLTGEMIDASKAKEIGLVNHVVEESHLSARTTKLAALIASKSSVTVSLGKETFYRQLNQPLNEAYKLCSEVMTHDMLKDEAKEGINAFLNKRLPDWKIEDD